MLQDQLGTNSIYAIYLLGQTEKQKSNLSFRKDKSNSLEVSIS